MGKLALLFLWFGLLLFWVGWLLTGCVFFN